MTALIPPDRKLPNQEAVDLVIALQRCLVSYHSSHEELAVLPVVNDGRLAMLERYLEARQLRHAILGQGLFVDPAWDILLLLFHAELNDQTLSLDQLCEAAHLSMMVVLRHVGVMERRGLLTGQPGSPGGGRRRLRLSPLATDAMTSWLYLAFDAGGPGNGPF